MTEDTASSRILLLGFVISLSLLFAMIVDVALEGDQVWMRQYEGQRVVLK